MRAIVHVRRQASATGERPWCQRTPERAPCISLGGQQDFRPRARRRTRAGRRRRVGLHRADARSEKSWAVHPQACQGESSRANASTLQDESLWTCVRVWCMTTWRICVCDAPASKKGGVSRILTFIECSAHTHARRASHSYSCCPSDRASSSHRSPTISDSQRRHRQSAWTPRHCRLRPPSLPALGWAYRSLQARPPSPPSSSRCRNAGLEKTHQAESDLQPQPAARRPEPSQAPPPSPLSRLSQDFRFCRLDRRTIGRRWLRPPARERELWTRMAPRTSR